MHVGWKTSFIEKRSSVNRRLYKFNFTITEEDYNVDPSFVSAPTTKKQQEEKDLTLSETPN